MKCNDAIDFSFELAKLEGACCMTVKDGHVLLIQRSFLEALLAKHDQDRIVIFLKRPDMNSGN